MPIDAYSPCPGGLDKKIKFCCPDLFGEWQKIDRMLDGEQYQACLQHVDRLIEKQGLRACLLATRCQLLRVMGREEEADRAAETFAEKFPESPLAMAELALSLAGWMRGPEAAEKIVTALKLCGERTPLRVYEAANEIARALAVQGYFQAARHLAAVLLDLCRDDESVLMFYLRLNASPLFPLLIKDPGRLECGPEDAPWKAGCDEAIEWAKMFRWKEAAERMAALAARHGDPPVLWRNVASLCGWLADAPGEVEALRKYASLDVPWEDAVEAESLALFLTEDPLKDSAAVLELSYEVEDVDELQRLLASSPNLDPIREDLRAYAEEDVPPPKAGFLLFSGPRPTSDTAVDPRSFPRLLAPLLLFGKQTDRPARLEAGRVYAGDLEQVESLLNQIAAGRLGAAHRVEQGRNSATRELLGRTFRVWEDATPEQMRQVAERYMERTVLEIWAEMPLGYLDGKSPRQAAADPAYRLKLPAAIALLEFWAEQGSRRFDFNRLRSSLGLPTLDPIDPEGICLDRLPLARLHRLIVEKLSDEDLRQLYLRTRTVNARKASEKFARAMVERPGLARRAETLQAYQILTSMAEDLDEALGWLQRGRQATDALGQSNASWDLMELSLRVARGEFAEFKGMVDHIGRQHAQEPGVTERLTRLFMDLGLLNPDGTPVMPAAPQPAAAEAPAIVVPGGEEPGKLWTPEAQQRASGSKSGLWTPGMD